MHDAAGIDDIGALVRRVADPYRAFEQQEPGAAGLIDVDVEDGAAHGDHSRRRAQLIVALAGKPGDEAEGALDEIDADGAGRGRGIVNELVEDEARSGAERQLGIVAQLQLAERVGSDLDCLVLANVVADGEIVFLLIE